MPANHPIKQSPGCAKRQGVGYAIGHAGALGYCFKCVLVLPRREWSACLLINKALHWLMRDDRQDPIHTDKTDCQSQPNGTPFMQGLVKIHNLHGTWHNAAKGSHIVMKRPHALKRGAHDK